MYGSISWASMQEKKRIAPKTIEYDVLPNGCWQWAGHVTTKGYGQLCINYQRFCAHRWYWEQAKGKIRKGLQIHHECGNKLCVNPDHMGLVRPWVHSEVDSNHGANIQRRKTHCPQGHPYTAENTYFINRRRVCVTCSRKRSLEYQRKKRARVKQSQQ